MKISSLLAAVPVVVVHTGLALCGYWWFLDKEIPITSEESRISKYEVLAGETVFIQRDYCVNSEISGTMRRSIVDGVIYHLPLTGTSVEPGCGKKDVVFEIPHSLPPGRYIYRVEIDYKLNPLRTITVSLPDVEFYILDPKGDKHAHRTDFRG